MERQRGRALLLLVIKGDFQEAVGGSWVPDKEQNGRSGYFSHGHGRATNLTLGPSTSSLNLASTTTSHAYPRTEFRLAQWPVLSQNPASWWFQLVFSNQGP